MTDSSRLALAFGMTLFAGLSTGIGSAIAFFANRTNTRFLSVSLGFSAGVMLYVSFVEILAKAQHALAADLGEVGGAWAAVAGFFSGILVIAVIDRLVPTAKNPHEVHRIEELHSPPSNHKLMRMGLFAALAIAIHNFPEGLAAFMAALDDPKIGMSIAIAIGLHNIPEGIAVSVPVYYATGNRKKAFTYSFLSGLAEPVGAVIGYVTLIQWAGPAIRGALFASVAGIMVFISLDELLPTAREYGEAHSAVYALIAGMAVMAVSLLLVM